MADDTTSLQLRFESGALGQIFCSTAATPHYRFAAYGTAGFTEILGHPMATYRLIPAIVARRPFPTPLSEIPHGVEVFEAVLRSAESGQPEMVV